MKLGDITIQNQADFLPVPYTNLFSRDVSLGSGTQSVTGLGFKPTFVLFFACIASTDFASWGWSSLTQEDAMIHYGDTDNFGGASFFPIRFSQSAGSNDITGEITSMDTDGFTITWTLQSGSPTGTARIVFMAFK